MKGMGLRDPSDKSILDFLNYADRGSKILRGVVNYIYQLISRCLTAFVGRSQSNRILTDLHVKIKDIKK